MKKLVFFIILIFICLSFYPIKGLALTVNEVKKQIDNTNEQIKKLDEEITKYKTEINKTNIESNNLSKIIKELTLTRDKLIKEREQIQKKIKKTGLVIENLSIDIKNKEDVISISKKSLGMMINDLNKKDSLSVVERLIMVNKFSDFSREYNNIIDLNKKIHENIIDISNKKELLESTKNEKENEHKNLNNLKKDLVAKEQAVITTKKSKDILLKETKNKETEYQKLLKDAEKRKNDFEKEMEDYENQLKSLINKKLLPKEGSGILSWPLDEIFITSKYGIRINPFNSSIKTFHYGLDFRAQSGTSVKSVESGTVIGVGNTDTACKGASFGNWILIKHNNGLSSTYGHLSSILVKKGQKINKGDIIGLSGGVKNVFGSGSSSGPHLHLSVYASDGVGIDSFESKACPGKILTQPRITKVDAHINPELYLPKINSEMVKK